MICGIAGETPNSSLKLSRRLAMLVLGWMTVLVLGQIWDIYENLGGFLGRLS